MGRCIYSDVPRVLFGFLYHCLINKQEVRAIALYCITNVHHLLLLKDKHLLRQRSSTTSLATHPESKHQSNDLDDITHPSIHPSSYMPGNLHPQHLNPPTTNMSPQPQLPQKDDKESLYTSKSYSSSSSTLSSIDTLVAEKKTAQHPTHQPTYQPKNNSKNKSPHNDNGISPTTKPELDIFDLQIAGYLSGPLPTSPRSASKPKSQSQSEKSFWSRAKGKMRGSSSSCSSASASASNGVNAVNEKGERESERIGRHGSAEKEEEMQQRRQSENTVNLGRSADFGMQSTSGRNMGSL